MHLKYYFGLIIVLFWSMFSVPCHGGGHEDCNQCHKNVSEKEYELIVKDNARSINPFTNNPYGKTDAFCISYHTFSSKSSHPVGIVPQSSKLSIPEDALGFSGQEGEISCLSCHNPHPDNTNYKYLRWAPENVYNLARFCVNCHTTKGNQKGITQISRR